jgi:hypothetical protein
MGRDGPVVPVEKGVKPPDILWDLSAICGEKALSGSTVFNWVWGF